MQDGTALPVERVRLLQIALRCPQPRQYPQSDRDVGVVLAVQPLPDRQRLASGGFRTRQIAGLLEQLSLVGHGDGEHRVSVPVVRAKRGDASVLQLPGNVEIAQPPVAGGQVRQRDQRVRALGSQQPFLDCQRLAGDLRGLGELLEVHQDHQQDDGSLNEVGTVGNLGVLRPE